MTLPICPVIPRMAPRRDWATRGVPGIADVELFLPAARALYEQLHAVFGAS